MDLKKFKWTREPQDYSVDGGKVEITTKPHTDLWQRTYYHFQNDNAPVFQTETDKRFFSFVVKTDFAESHHRFDQCGIVMYLNSENWLKASVEYENERFQHLGSVVTNGGYSDWATTVIPSDVKSMWYRFSRREDDYCVECSKDGVEFSQMRICHMSQGTGKIRFGIYACSPEDSSFKAVFTDMEIMECQWKAHDGQQPDIHKKFKGGKRADMRNMMKRELGIARCGLACCLCSENITCNGCNSRECPDNDWCENRKCSLEKGITHCYACEEDCKKGILSKIKPYAFTLFIKRYGEDKLLDCLEENEKKGIIYHREGLNGDYDDFDDVEKLIEFIKTGEENR